MWDSSDQTGRIVGAGQTKQTEMLLLATPHRPRCGYWPDQTDRNGAIDQTKETEMWELARPNRPKYCYWLPHKDQDVGIGQTKQTEMGLLARPNRPKVGIGQTKHTECKYWPDQTNRNGTNQTNPIISTYQLGHLLFRLTGLTHCDTASCTAPLYKLSLKITKADLKEVIIVHLLCPKLINMLLAILLLPLFASAITTESSTTTTTTTGLAVWTS